MLSEFKGCAKWGVGGPPYLQTAFEAGLYPFGNSFVSCEEWNLALTFKALGNKLL